MSQRKFTQKQSNKVQEDVEFGKLQAQCNAITIWNVLFIIVGSVLFVGCLNYMLNELRSSDDTGRIFCIVGLIATLGAVIYGAFNILMNRVEFYEYGIVRRKERLLYDNIEVIYVRRIIMSGRMLTANRRMYSIKSKEGTALTLDSDDFQGLNDMMKTLADDLELPIEKY